MGSLGERLNPAALADGALERTGRLLSHHTAIGRFVTAADSPAYVRLTSAKRREIDPDEIDWCDIDADPNAGQMPRHRESVAIMATPTSIYQELIGDDGEEGDLPKDALHTPGVIRDAVAWLSEGIVRVGVRSDGENVFGGMRVDGEQQFAVARRREPEATQASLGFWVAGEEKFVAIPRVSVVEPSIEIGRIGQEPYQHLSVV